MLDKLISPRTLKTTETKDWEQMMGICRLEERHAETI